MKPHPAPILSWPVLVTLVSSISMALVETQVTKSYLVSNDQSSSNGKSNRQQFPLSLHMSPAIGTKTRLSAFLQKATGGTKSSSISSSAKTAKGQVLVQDDVILFDARPKRSVVPAAPENSEVRPARNSASGRAEPTRNTARKIKARQLSGTNIQADDLEAAGQTQTLSYARPPDLLGGTLAGAFGGLGGVGGFGSGLGLGFGSILGNGLSSLPVAGSAGFLPNLNLPLAGQPPLHQFSPSVANFGGLSLGGAGAGAGISGFNSASLPNFASQSFSGGLNLGSFGNGNNFGSPKLPSDALLPTSARTSGNNFDILRQLSSNPFQSAFKANNNNPTLSPIAILKEERLKELEKEVERDLDLSDKQLTPQQQTTKAIYESIEGILREPQVTTSQGLNGIHDYSTKSIQDTTVYSERTTKPSIVESLNYKVGGDLQGDVPSPPTNIPTHSSDRVNNKKQGHNFVSENGFPIDKNSKLTPFEPKAHDIPQITATLPPPKTITGYVTTGLPRISASEPVTVLPPREIVLPYKAKGEESTESVFPGISDVNDSSYLDSGTNNDYESSLQSVEHTSQNSHTHHLSEYSTESRAKESPIRFEDRPIPIGRPRLKHPSFDGYRLQENNGRPPPFGIPDVLMDVIRAPSRHSQNRQPGSLSSLMHRNKHRHESALPRNRPPFPSQIQAHQEDFQPFMHPVGTANREMENAKANKPHNHLDKQAFRTPSPKPGKHGSTPDPVLHLHMGNNFPNSHQQRPEERSKNTLRLGLENDHGIKLKSLPPGHNERFSSVKPPVDNAPKTLTEFGLRTLLPKPKSELSKLLSIDEIRSLIELQNPNSTPNIDFSIGSSTTDETIVHPDKYFAKENKANGDDELILTNASGDLTEKHKYSTKETEAFSSLANETQEIKRISFDMMNKKFINPTSHLHNRDNSKEHKQISVPSPPPALSYPGFSTTINEIDSIETSQPTKQPFIDIYDYQLDDTEADSVRKTIQKLFVPRDLTVKTAEYVKELKAQQNNTNQIELPPTDSSSSAPPTFSGPILSQPSVSETSTAPRLQPSTLKVQISSPIHADTLTTTLTPNASISSYPQPKVTESVDSLQIQEQHLSQGSLTLNGDVFDSTHQIGIQIKHRGNTGIRSEQENVDLYSTTEAVLQNEKDSSSEPYKSTPTTQYIVPLTDSVVQAENAYSKGNTSDDKEETYIERYIPLFRETVTINLLNPKQETATALDQEIYLSDASDNLPEEYISPTFNPPLPGYSSTPQELSQRNRNSPELVTHNPFDKSESKGQNTPQSDSLSQGQLNYTSSGDDIPEYYSQNYPNTSPASVGQPPNGNSYARNSQRGLLRRPPRPPLKIHPHMNQQAPSARPIPLSQRPSAGHLPVNESPLARHSPSNFRISQARHTTRILPQSRGKQPISYNPNRSHVPNRVNPLVSRPANSGSEATEFQTRSNSRNVPITLSKQATMLSLSPHLYGDQQHSSSTISALSQSPSTTTDSKPVTSLETPSATFNSLSNQYQENLRAHESADKPQNPSISPSLEIPPLSATAEDFPRGPLSIPAVTNKATSATISLQTEEVYEVDSKYSNPYYTTELISGPSFKNYSTDYQEDIYPSDITSQASSFSFNTPEITKTRTSSGQLISSSATPTHVYSSSPLPVSSFNPSSTPSSLPTQVAPSVLYDDNTSRSESAVPSSLNSSLSISSASLSHSSSNIQPTAISLATETPGLVSLTDSTVSVLSKPSVLSPETQNSNLLPSNSSEPEIFIVENTTPGSSKSPLRSTLSLEKIHHHHVLSSEDPPIKKHPLTTPAPFIELKIFPDLTTQATSPYTDSSSSKPSIPFQLIARHLRYTTASSPKISSSYATTITTRRQQPPATTASSVKPELVSPVNKRIPNNISFDSSVTNSIPEYLLTSSSSDLVVTQPASIATKETPPSGNSPVTSSITESSLADEDVVPSAAHLPELPLRYTNVQLISTRPQEHEHTTIPSTPVSPLGRRKPTPVVRRLSSKRFSAQTRNQNSTGYDIDDNRGVGRRPLPSAQDRKESLRVAGFRRPTSRS